MKSTMFPKIPSQRVIFRRRTRTAPLLIGILMLLAVIALHGWAHADATYGQASDLFTIGAGARTMAMGGAFTAIADDASAPYYNPAGLAYIDEHQITLMHAPLFLDSSYNYLSTVNPFGDKWGSLALSDALLMSNNIESRDKFNNLTSDNGTFNNNAIMLSYAHKLRQKLSLGANVKFIQQKILGYSGSDMTMDVGFLAHPWSFLSVGGSIANVNSPEVTLQSSPDVYHPITRFGVASDVFKGKLTLAADVVRISHEGNMLAVGAELSPSKLFSLRAGYNDSKSFTMGVGLNLKTLRVDYALSNTDLGAFNKVSVTWAWHNIYKTEIEPPMKDGRAIYPLTGFENRVTFKTKVPDQFAASWTLLIKDSNGKEVRALNGDLRPPKDIIWDAKNGVGEPVVDGLYSYSFIVNYKNGKMWRTGGDLNLVLPNRKVGDDTNMNIQLNGAQTGDVQPNNAGKPATDAVAPQPTAEQPAATTTPADNATSAPETPKEAPATNAPATEGK